MNGREGERQEIGRERYKETERQKDRKRQRDREGETDRQTEREKERERERVTNNIFLLYTYHSLSVGIETFYDNDDFLRE